MDLEWYGQNKCSNRLPLLGHFASVGSSPLAGHARDDPTYTQAFPTKSERQTLPTHQQQAISSQKWLKTPSKSSKPSRWPLALPNIDPGEPTIVNGLMPRTKPSYEVRNPTIISSQSQNQTTKTKPPGWREASFRAIPWNKPMPGRTDLGPSHIIQTSDGRFRRPAEYIAAFVTERTGTSNLDRRGASSKRNWYMRLGEPSWKEGEVSVLAFYHLVREREDGGTG